MLQTDVLFWADIFLSLEVCVCKCLQDRSLSLLFRSEFEPGGMLISTRVKLILLQDIILLLFVERGFGVE